MKIEFEKYIEYSGRVPGYGKHILAFQNAESVVVYQAYRREIAEYAVSNQYFGGPHYSYNRMSWIKPNFLWMMYRCGWGTKSDQERVLAIWIGKNFFEKILGEAVHSSFKGGSYSSVDEWKDDMGRREVRLQWDPDHDPLGKPQDRRAIQLGLKGNILKEFGQSQILKIDDMSGFVNEQRHLLETGKIHDLMIPKETVFIPENQSIKSYVGLDET